MIDPAAPFSLVLHGGAGLLAKGDYAEAVEDLRDLAQRGRARLGRGEAALDVAVDLVRAMEASGLYVAGKGSSPNSAGVYELDAAVMTSDRCAGAVAALEGFLSPVEAARAVMERTRHVTLAGAGAAAFALGQGLAMVDHPDAYYVPAGGPDPRDIPTGTVGCVARDKAGALAAVSSTGGTLRKRYGRVGDTGVIGAGIWADETVAVACTGQGEYFIRAGAAAQVSARMRFGGERLSQAVAASLADVAALGGDGGIIAVSARGEIAAQYNSAGMKRALLHPDGRIEAGLREALS